MNKQNNGKDIIFKAGEKYYIDYIGVTILILKTFPGKYLLSMGNIVDEHFLTIKEERKLKLKNLTK
jgi:hypothetical protein